LFTKLLSFDRSARRRGGEPKQVCAHIEWILQRPFQNVAEWLGAEGDKFRKLYGMRSPSEQFKVEWTAFLAAHCEYSHAEVEAQLNALQLAFEQEPPRGEQQPSRRRRRAS
jgi:hypothetical protein